MKHLSNRRDFLKIVIGGTGATYLALQGCGDVSKQFEQVKGPTLNAVLKRQRYEIAHAYLRDRSFDSKKVIDTPLTCEVLVLGAGASGLAAALTLQDAGIDVMLLEHETQIGGVGIHGEMHGISYPYGSVYCVDNSPLIQDVCSRTGLSIMSAPEDAILRNGALIERFWLDSTIQNLDLPQIEQDGLRKFRDVLLDQASLPTYPLPAVLSNEKAQLDAISAKSYLASYKTPYLESLMDLYARSSMGAGLSDVNAYCLLNFYASELGKEFGNNRYTFPGGMNALYKAMASLIHKGSIKTSHLAFSANNSKVGCEVRCVNDQLEILTIKAKRIIMTGHKHSAAYMIQDLTEEQKSAMMSMQYPPYATIHFSSKEELFPKHIMDVWTPEAEAFCTDIICSNAMQSVSSKDAYVYSIFGAMSMGLRAQLMDDKVLAAYSLDIVEKTMNYLGKRMDLLTDIEVFGWGHALAIPFPGSHNGPAQRASKTHGTIYFGASDNDAASSVENALGNGYKAAKEVISSLQ